jgi:hypothetical protein
MSFEETIPDHPSLSQGLTRRYHVALYYLCHGWEKLCNRGWARVLDYSSWIIISNFAFIVCGSSNLVWSFWEQDLHSAGLQCERKLGWIRWIVPYLWIVTALQIMWGWGSKQQSNLGFEQQTTNGISLQLKSIEAESRHQRNRSRNKGNQRRDERKVESCRTQGHLQEEELHLGGCRPKFAEHSSSGTTPFNLR